MMIFKVTFYPFNTDLSVTFLQDPNGLTYVNSISFQHFQALSEVHEDLFERCFFEVDELRRLERRETYLMGLEDKEAYDLRMAETNVERTRIKREQVKGEKENSGSLI